MIRKSADWMKLLDERILESLKDYGSSQPSLMEASKGINGSEEEIHKRCKKLQREGLIMSVSKNTYRISRAGESYLDGELDLEEDEIMESSAEEIRYPPDQSKKKRNKIDITQPSQEKPYSLSKSCARLSKGEIILETSYFQVGVRLEVD